MRIALFTYRGNMFCGGQGIYAAYLAKEWKKAGHDVHVFAGPPYPELDEGIPLHKIHNDNVFAQEHPDFFDPERPFSLLRPLSLWELGVSRFGVFPEMQTFGFRMMMRWKAYQEKYKFDVVFDNQTLSWGLLAIQAMGVPVVSVIHHPLHIDREADYTIDPRLIKKIKRTLYFPLFMQERVAPRLASIVTVSEASRKEIERYFKIPEKEIPVVYNGTDTEIFHPHPDVEKDSDLLFVGRTEDRKKGIGTMIEALSLLPEHINLKIVDGRIPENGLVPRLIRKYRLENRITIVDEMLTRDELVRAYSSGRAAIVPSFFEGFGFPASEAMACGLPVIANAAGALPEVVGTDGRSGKLVPARDAQAMAQAAREILLEPGKAQAMGQAARRRVEHVFRWDDAAASLVEVFKDTIRATDRRSRAA
ncbi:MAG: glycosyltransferase family 4 protein [Deltaproteobacteria bacterium]|nr:glycosyltransferase family 4 protein [Deltaproteobacteria bacterium]MBW2389714.1 glycosyltransferase family 4 protein [Deltaproteobacteria bacterium]MBW2725359.1 glycosyltransferase family 4 protein [Deltaproteobacteria bacterium]